jgi:DNA-binding transcriptional MerR regulator
LNKAPDAFRTISEVADDLDLPQHVLRFWESRFPQIRPMKRGGGRRYYRPEDIDLLRGIRHLLYGEGYTIRGVQRILREQGLRTVQSVGQGRVVTLPEPSREDGAEADPEIEAGPGIRKFLPPRPSGAAAEGALGARDAEETADDGYAGSRRSAGTLLQGDVADTDSDRPSQVPADMTSAGVAPADLAADLAPTRLAPTRLAPTHLAPTHLAPTHLAPETAVPVFVGLAPADLDRLKTALQRLEECRRLLAGAGGAG